VRRVGCAGGESEVHPAAGQGNDQCISAEDFEVVDAGGRVAPAWSGR
jgi:hypothetical protein